MTKQFHNYRVVLHNHFKQSKIRIIKKCVSKTAAVRVANLLEKMESASNYYWGTMAYELDSNGKVVY